VTFELRRYVAATDMMSRTGECIAYRPLIVERGISGESTDDLQTLSLKLCLAVIFLQIRLCCCKAISAVGKTVLRRTFFILFKSK
jgi:hypothetical protein